MSDLRTAAQQALEAWDTRAGIDTASRAFEALRAALAQQDEPVAWMEPPHGAIRANPNYKFTFPSQLLHWRIPLYLAPPQRKPLTQEESDNIYREFTLYQDRLTPSVLQRVVRAVERAHGIGEQP